jgi:hypothetical protein
VLEWIHWFRCTRAALGCAASIAQVMCVFLYASSSTRTNLAYYLANRIYETKAAAPGDAGPEMNDALHAEGLSAAEVTLNQSADEEHLDSPADHSGPLQESATEAGAEGPEGWRQMWPGPKVMDASAVREGRALPVLAGILCDYMPQDRSTVAHRNILAMPSELSVMSLCTGSGMDARVLEAFSAALKDRGIVRKFSIRAMAEADPAKRAWCKAWEGPNTCMFADVRDMGEPVAPCTVHKDRNKDGQSKSKKAKVDSMAECPVPRCDMVFCGSSCKYFSKMATKKSHGPASTFLAHGKDRGGQDHSSLRTFDGFLAYLESAQPPMFIWENVEAVADTSHDPDDRAACSSV